MLLLFLPGYNVSSNQRLWCKLLICADLKMFVTLYTLLYLKYNTKLTLELKYSQMSQSLLNHTLLSTKSSTAKLRNDFYKFSTLVCWIIQIGLMYHNNIVVTLTNYLWPSHIGGVLRLPHAAGLEVLRNASLRITLIILEVVDTENWVTSSLPFLHNPKGIV